MKKFASYAVAISTLTLLQCVSLIGASAQQNPTPPMLKPPTIDIKDIILTVSPLIDVEYQGESVVVLRAEENALLLSNGTLIPFWNAIDVVKHYGYSLNDVTTSGMGSQGNPTRFYAIMSKP
jgi:hypothetical protein